MFTGEIALNIGSACKSGAIFVINTTKGFDILCVLMSAFVKLIQISLVVPSIQLMVNIFAVFANETLISFNVKALFSNTSLKQAVSSVKRQNGERR